MAGTKVKDLTLKSVLSSTDEFYINDVENGNVDKKTTVGDINNFILPIAISDVTSLQTALDGKSATGHTHVLANITDVTITATNLNILDDGVNTTLHFHDSDRARANHTGTQLKATISDFAHTHPLSEISDVTASATELNILDGATLDVTELNYVDGVTSSIQTQINSKQATITGGATTITTSDLTADKVLISSGTGKVAVSGVSTTTLGYLDATSSIQTQLNGKQATLSDAANIAYTDVANMFTQNQTIQKESGSSLFIGVIYNDTNTSGGFAGQRARGTISSPTAVQNGDFLFRILGQGYDSGGTPGFQLSGSFDIISGETRNTGGQRGTYARMSTTPIGSTTVTEVIRFNAGGDIGIVSGKHIHPDGLTGTGDTYLVENGANILELNAGVSGASGTINLYCGNGGTAIGSLTTTGLAITGTITQTGKTTKYNNINTAGIGSTSVFASFIGSSSSGSQSNIINYTPPSTAGTYRVSASIATTAGTNTGTITITITYKDAVGTSITFLPPFSQTGSATLLTACTGASKNFNLVGHTFTINNAGTAITVSTTVTGTVAYFVNAVLEQLA